MNLSTRIKSRIYNNTLINFIFVYVSTGNLHFLNDKMCISCDPESLLNSVEEHQKSALWKPDSMAAASHYICFLAWNKKKPTFKSKFTSAEA